MLIIDRTIDQTMCIGDTRTVVAQLTPIEEAALRGVTDPILRALASRLLSTLGTPMEVHVLRLTSTRARLGFTVDKGIPLCRKEVAPPGGVRFIPHRDPYVPPLRIRPTVAI